MGADEVFETHPQDENDNLLRQKFYEDIAKQSERVDALNAHLLTIELAIPGAYAGILKLISGDKAVLQNLPMIWLSFGLWLIALILTLIALTPKQWRVDTSVLVQDPHLMDQGMGIEDYFIASARYKRRLAIAASLFFFAGIASAVFTIG